MGLMTKLAERKRTIQSCLCIGIDPDDEDIENFMKEEKENEYKNIKNNLKEDAINFIEKGKDLLLKICDIYNLGNQKYFYFLNHFSFYIINNTKNFALIYKMNFAFFVVYGSQGIDALKNIFLFLKHINIPTILDIKLNDIGNTIKKYQSFVFEYLKSDSCTVNIYMGADILKHICYDELKNKYYSVYVIIKTTNPDSYLFQNQLSFNNKKAYILMAEEAKKVSEELQIESNDEFIGFVIGANSYDEIAIIRKQFPNCFILSPGVGAQKADLRKTLINGFNSNYENLLINVGRAITKSKNPYEAAHSFYEDINNVIKSININIK